jgi:hypothetical protein
MGPRAKSKKHASSKRRRSPKGSPLEKTRNISKKGAFIGFPDGKTLKTGGRYKFDGVVALKDKEELKKCIASLWKELPEDFSLFHIKPEVVKNCLNRDQKRALLAELANTKEYTKQYMKLEVPKGKSEEGLKHEKFKHKAKFSYAAILIVDLALRASEKDNTCNLFAELVGCATADTVDELTPVLRYPFITLEELPTLIHCTVRQYVCPNQNVVTSSFERFTQKHLL